MLKRYRIKRLKIYIAGVQAEILAIKKIMAVLEVVVPDHADRLISAEKKLGMLEMTLALLEK